MSQAEHDVLASSIVLCFSKEKAAEIVKEVEKQVQSLSRKEIIEKSLKDFGAVIICDSIEKAIDTAEDIAPEHIELMVDNPFEILGRINNAGSIFLGGNTPEPMGDYFAGPNHVLPTSGTARFFSPLSVDSFIKKSSFLYYSGQALLDASEDVIKIAEAEGLTAHANSVKIRVNNKNN